MGADRGGESASLVGHRDRWCEAVGDRQLNNLRSGCIGDGDKRWTADGLGSGCIAEQLHLQQFISLGAEIIGEGVVEAEQALAIHQR